MTARLSVATLPEEIRDEPSDGELFARVARGEIGPLGTLFDRHHAAVRAFARRVTGDAADADDLVQETFLTAQRAAASFEPGGTARPFLLGVAAQLARRRRRTFARLRAFLTSFGEAPRAPLPDQEAALAAAEEAAHVNAVVASLPLEHRLVLGMVELGGLTGVEAAKALDVPVGTVWRRLHEARGMLRRKLERRLR